MSLPLTNNAANNIERTGIQDRSLRLARLIADQLSDRQQPNGAFPQHSFYAPAFAAALWAQLDPSHYAAKIETALTALETEHQDQRYHREFIEYALWQIPGLDRARRTAILRDAPTQSPDVANWQMLGLINGQLSQKHGAGKSRRFMNWLRWTFIRQHYWLAPLFWDRPSCFSGQYHAFCAALLTDSPKTAHQKIAAQATALIADLCDDHGYPNLLGRGAGQSFGAVCALYALAQHGFHHAADAILFRLETAMLTTGTLPLNLLSQNPLPDDPGPANPATPGWYGYNRHDDYLAFAGYWLLKVATSTTEPKPQPSLPNLITSPISIFSGPAYQAQMCPLGKRSFDITPCPVVLSGTGTNATLLFAPTGGEEDANSLYGPPSVPLPASIDGTQFAHIRRAFKLFDTVEIAFKLAGVSGTRTITFNDHEITITDEIATKCDLLRLLLHVDVKLIQTAPNQLNAPELGITFRADHDLIVSDPTHFTAAGPARMITAPNANRVTLRICWGNCP